MDGSQFQPINLRSSLSSNVERKAKEIRPLRVVLGFLAGLVLSCIPGVGWAGLIIFLIISFREDRSLFVGILIAMSLVLLLVATCFALLDFR